MRLRRSQRLHTAISLVFVGLLSVVQVAGQLGAAFAAPLTVECCCGEHDADTDCGCPDCPASVFQSDSERDSDSDAIRPCGQEGDQVVSPSTSHDWNVGGAIELQRLTPLAWQPPDTASTPLSVDRTACSAPS